MIQMIRVDYRLLHGQVAVSWTSALGADCILLVSDTVLNDKLRLQALSLAKAMGVKKINLGNVAFSEDARQVSTSVFLTPENEAYVKELLGEGYELFIQMIPADAKTDAAKAIG